MKTIPWPDLRFPPINLWNAPLLAVALERTREPTKASLRVKPRAAPHAVMNRLLAGR